MSIYYFVKWEKNNVRLSFSLPDGGEGVFQSIVTRANQENFEKIRGI